MILKKDAYAWGSHFYKTISEDLQAELPDVKSFSPRNLLYMHQFYRLFPEAYYSEPAADRNGRLRDTLNALKNLSENPLTITIEDKEPDPPAH